MQLSVALIAEQSPLFCAGMGKLQAKILRRTMTRLFPLTSRIWYYANMILK